MYSLSAFDAVEFGAVSAFTVASPNEQDITLLSPAFPITAGNFLVRLTAAPGSTGSRMVILRSDGVDTALSCGFSGPITTCDAGSTVQTIPGGSLITLRFVSTGTPDTSDALVSWSFVR